MPSDRTSPRTVSVPAERLAGWISRFQDRHGAVEATVAGPVLRLQAADGATADVAIPFPPLAPAFDAVAALVEHVRRERRVGAILVRRGGYAVGVFAGASLLRSKVGSSYVQGKTKAGGWSQQRYARRRANQADQAYAEAADVAATVLLPEVGRLEAVIGGGDKVGVRAVLADTRLAPVASLLIEPIRPTADPRLRVLQGFPEQFRAVDITLNQLA
jgi:hypothetical protein